VTEARQGRPAKPATLAGNLTVAEDPEGLLWTAAVALRQAKVPDAEIAQVAVRLLHERQLRRLSAAVESSPQNPGVLLARADWYAAQGRWKESAQDYARAARLPGSDAAIQMAAAVLLLKAADVETYRRHAHAMRQRLGTADSIDVLEKTAKACLLIPEAVGEPRELLVLAERAVLAGQASGFLGNFQATAALANLRAGRLPEALAWSAKARRTLKAKDLGSPEIEALIGVVEAMALDRSGDRPGARRALATATGLLERGYWKPAAPGFSGAPPVDWLIAELLHAEAKKQFADRPDR
jgi:hypothetical protein